MISFYYKTSLPEAWFPFWSQIAILRKSVEFATTLLACMIASWCKAQYLFTLLSYMPIATLLRTITCHWISVKTLFFDAKVLVLKWVQYAFIKTFNPGNNLKWNYEALALHIKVKSNKKRHPLTYSGCVKLHVCNSFTIDLNGRIWLRSAVRTRQYALWCHH